MGVSYGIAMMNFRGWYFLHLTFFWLWRKIPQRSSRNVVRTEIQMRKCTRFSEGTARIRRELILWILLKTHFLILFSLEHLTFICFLIDPNPSCLRVLTTSLKIYIVWLLTVISVYRRSLP